MWEIFTCENVDGIDKSLYRELIKYKTKTYTHVKWFYKKVKGPEQYDV